jgi:hypothetical protein
MFSQRRVRPASALVRALVVLLLTACSHAPAADEQVRQIESITAAVEALRQSFETKDATAFFERYPSGDADEQRRLRALLTTLESPSLSFAIDRIQIDPSAAAVFLHWELRWQADAQPQRARGNSVFHIQGGAAGAPARVTSVTLENPFLAPLQSSPSRGS